MTTATLTASTSKTAALAFTILFGVLIVAFTEHVQASSLHTSAHDVRHANGFPCH